jgi:hypothetical protein
MIMHGENKSKAIANYSILRIYIQYDDDDDFLAEN